MTNMFLPFEVPALLPFLGSIALLALSMAGFRKLSGVWLFLSGLAAIEAIFVFAYYGKAPRHSGILLVWLVAAQWIASASAGPDRRSEKKQYNLRLVRRANLYPLALTLMTAWNLPLQIDIYRIERDLDYSEAYLAAEVLNMAEYKDRQIVCWLPRNCLAVIAYLSDPTRKFWYPVQERAGTFELWDARSHAVNTYMESRVQPFSTILSDTRARFKNWGMAGGPLFISSKMVDEPGALGLQLLKTPPGNAWRILDESFWIYAPSGDSAGAQGATLP
jgi:hypothetical protein